MSPNIKIPLGICLLNIFLAFMFSYAIEAGMSAPAASFTRNLANSADMLGPVSAAGGFADLLIAIFLLAFKKNKTGAGFLLSACALLLMGLVLHNHYS